jgi:hypothetical protein
MVFVRPPRKKSTEVPMAIAGTCIHLHFACPPITSSIIPTYTVKPPYYDFEKNTILRINKYNISQMEKPETASLLRTSAWKLVFTLSHHTTERPESFFIIYQNRF